MGPVKPRPRGELLLFPGLADPAVEPPAAPATRPPKRAIPERIPDDVAGALEHLVLVDGRCADCLEVASAWIEGWAPPGVDQEFLLEQLLDEAERAQRRADARARTRTRDGGPSGSRATQTPTRPGAARPTPPRPTTPAPAPPPARPPATHELSLPAVGPAGAALSIELAPLGGLLAALARPGAPEGGEAVELAADALRAACEETFDRLLALATVQGVTHYPHQLETVLRVLKRFYGRVLLADEVGLGKTIEASLVLSEYLTRGLVRRALVLCPAALVAQWKGELEEKFGIAATTTLDPAFRQDPRAFFARDGVLVASLATARMKSHRDTLEAQRFDLVIVDEAHHLKNRATRGWELVNALRARFLLLLTATPIETDLSELYNLVTLLRPGTLGTEAQFRKRFATPGDPLAPRDAHGLRELLRDVMIRNTRAASGVGLPPRSVRTLVVDPSDDERALYQELVELARAEKARADEVRASGGKAERTQPLLRLLLEEAGSSALAVARTAESARATGALADGLRRVAARARALATSRKLELLVDLVPGGKLLVFTRFLATHEALLAELERRGVACVAFVGGMSAERRAEAVLAFRGPVDVMVCSEVGGEGQNLQFCHRLLNFDLPWNPMLIEQRVGRLHRIGQTEPVEIINLCTAGTAEERILTVLDQRVGLFELVVGELDLILGDVEDERDFGEQVFEVYAGTRTDEEVARGFEALGERLLAARQGLERTKAAAAATFGDELGA